VFRTPCGAVGTFDQALIASGKALMAAISQAVDELADRYG